jgi:hypothetical protein
VLCWFITASLPSKPGLGGTAPRHRQLVKALPVGNHLVGLLQSWGKGAEERGRASKRALWKLL